MRQSVNFLLVTIVLFGLIAILLLSFYNIPLYQSSTNKASINQSAEANLTKTFNNKELHIAVFQGGYGQEYWKEIVSRFEEAYPGVQVNMTISPRIGDVIRPQIIAGNPPDFLAITDTDQTGIMSSLLKEQGLLDITDVFEDKALDKDIKIKDMVLPGILNSTRFSPYEDGKIYLAPFNASPMGLIYNKTLFQEKNWSLPNTWEEFFKLEEELKKPENYVEDENGQLVKRALFTYQGIYPDYLEEILYPSLANAAGLSHLKRIFAYEPGSFDSPEVKQTLDMIAKIGTEHYLMDGTVNLNHTQAQTAMMLGKALFIVNGTWMENEMKYSPREPGFQFGMIPVPVFNKGDEKFVLSSYEQFSIPLKAKNPELAKEFLKFLYTDESIMLFAEKSNGVYALINAQELSKQYLTPGVYEMFGAYEGATAITLEWKVIPKDAKFDIRDHLFKKTITPIMTGNMTTEEWIQQIEAVFSDLQNMTH